MNVILLSGGSGTRLWPLSNDVRSKQFLKILKRKDGVRESMAQRMYRMIKDIDRDSKITIATSQNQVASIHNQLGTDIGISIEPCRRDTFPAISLASAYLKKNGVSDNEPIVVCPVDPYVDENYFECLKELSDEAKKGESNLTLMGIEPTCPSEKYGYIIPLTKDSVSEVKEFKEKPSRVVAEEYIKQGALWNGGIFAYKLGYVLDVAEKEFGTSDYDALLKKYSELKKISFDYAVVEKEKRIKVVRFNGLWKDLGTWDTLLEVMAEQTSGNSTAVECENTHIINELPIPLIAMGIKDVVIVASPDGILVADKEKSSNLKNYATEVALRPMYEKREWGEYKVLEYDKQPDNNNSLTKHLVIKAGKNISYQKHHKRDEIWTIINGEGLLLLDGKVKKVTRGDIAYIKREQLHAMKAISDLHFVEVQIGDDLIEEDIERFEWPTEIDERK